MPTAEKEKTQELPNIFFGNAMEQWAQASKSTDRIAAVHRAVNFAVIVASDETTNAMIRISGGIEQMAYGEEIPDSIEKDKAMMLVYMQRDMTLFNAPTIEQIQPMPQRGKAECQKEDRGAVKL